MSTAINIARLAIESAERSGWSTNNHTAGELANQLSAILDRAEQGEDRLGQVVKGLDWSPARKPVMAALDENLNGVVVWTAYRLYADENPRRAIDDWGQVAQIAEKLSARFGIDTVVIDPVYHP